MNAIMKNLNVTVDNTSVYKDDAGKRTYLPMYKFSTVYTDDDHIIDATTNIAYDKSQYGAGNAYNLAQARQEESMLNALGIE